MTNISLIFNNKVPNKTEIKKAFKANKEYNLKLLHKLNQECLELNDNNYYRSRVITHLFGTLLLKISEILVIVSPYNYFL